MLLLLIAVLPCLRSLKFDQGGPAMQQVIRRENRMNFQREHPVKFCQDYDYNADKCAQCFEGYSLFGDQCLLDERDTRLSPILIVRNPYCSHYNSKDKCVSCFEGYVFEEGECILDSRNADMPPANYILPALDPGKLGLCSSIDHQGRCHSCFRGATLQQGSCQLPNYQQYHCLRSDSCYPIVTACDVYAKQGYCKSCSEGSVNMNGQCRLLKRLPLCERHDAMRRCIRCSSLAVLSRGKCLYRQPHCLEQDEHSLCLKCNDQSMLFNGECHTYASSIPFFYEEPNCVSWRNGKCFQCAPSWNLTAYNLCRKENT